MTSCSAHKTALITDGFSCTVNCTYDGTVYEGTLERISAQKTTLTLTQPLSVRGLIMTQTASGVVIEKDGVSYSAKAQAYPSGVLIGILHDALDEARGSEEVTVCGDGKAGAYTLHFDEREKTVSLLEMQDIPLVVRFSNVKIYTRDTGE